MWACTGCCLSVGICTSNANEPYEGLVTHAPQYRGAHPSTNPTSYTYLVMQVFPLYIGSVIIGDVNKRKKFGMPLTVMAFIGSAHTLEGEVIANSTAARGLCQTVSDCPHTVMTVFWRETWLVEETTLLRPCTAFGHRSGWLKQVVKRPVAQMISSLPWKLHSKTRVDLVRVS